jgi:hypothetical protein
VQVSKLLKTSEGTVKFEGELTEEEHEFVVNIGLATLMEQGAIPFVTTDEENAYKFIPGNEEMQ